MQLFQPQAFKVGLDCDDAMDIQECQACSNDNHCLVNEPVCGENGRCRSESHKLLVIIVFVEPLF